MPCAAHKGARAVVHASDLHRCRSVQPAPLRALLVPQRQACWLVRAKRLAIVQAGLVRERRVRHRLQLAPARIRAIALLACVDCRRGGGRSWRCRADRRPFRIPAARVALAFVRAPRASVVGIVGVGLAAAHHLRLASAPIEAARQVVIEPPGFDPPASAALICPHELFAAACSSKEQH